MGNRTEAAVPLAYRGACLCPRDLRLRVVVDDAAGADPGLLRVLVVVADGVLPREGERPLWVHS